MVSRGAGRAVVARAQRGRLVVVGLGVRAHAVVGVDGAGGRGDHVLVHGEQHAIGGGVAVHNRPRLHLPCAARHGRNGSKPRIALRGEDVDARVKRLREVQVPLVRRGVPRAGGALDEVVHRIVLEVVGQVRELGASLGHVRRVDLHLRSSYSKRYYMLLKKVLRVCTCVYRASL